MDEVQIATTLRNHSQDLADHSRRLASLEAREFVIGDLVSPFFGLPGLRGLWTGGNADNSGNLIDWTGQARTLTYNGNPAIHLTANRIPYFDYDGTGDFHSRPDEAGLDILGTETYLVSSLRGVTLGGWFYSNAGGTGQGLLGKRNATGSQKSYLLEVGTGPAVQFLVSTDGINDVSVTNTTLVTAGQWFFGVGRFNPSTELKVWMNGASAVNTTGIPASIFNSTAAFQVAAFNAGANLLVGRMALGFLCAAYLTDDLVDYLFARTRQFFQVSPA